MKKELPSLLLLCGLTAFAGSRAQEPLSQGAAALTPALSHRLTFLFTPRLPGQAPWEINVQADRSGSFRELPPIGDSTAIQPLHVSEAVWKRLAAAEHAVQGGHCETRLKGIAQTGEKRLAVVDGPEPAMCVFNYSDDPVLNDSASAFIALAETIQQGAKLQHDHRFDKLALDEDMETLASDVAAGRALEPENIAPVLRSLMEDERVIDRVRRRAARLLQDAGVDAPALPDKPR